MDILLNLANVLYVIAYFTTDMLRLRILTTTAAMLLVAYFCSQPVPLWNVVAWNLMFLGLNITQIARLTIGRRHRAADMP